MENLVINQEKIYHDMMTRDTNDSSRKVAPLIQADDAIAIDTTELSLEEVVQLMQQHIKDKKLC